MGPFLTHGSNPGLPYCRQTLCGLSHQGSPQILHFSPYIKMIEVDFWASQAALVVKNLPVKRHELGTWVGKIPWRRGEGNGTPVQYSCLENPMDGRAWWAAVHGVTKCRTQLSDFTFTFHCYALEKEMATHSSVLAWRIPEMGEPDGLPSMG